VSQQQADTGGFFQQVTGWKLAPLTPWVNVSRLARAADLPGPRLPDPA
jgi:hypothetical protein